MNDSLRVAPLDGEGIADPDAALTGEHLGDGNARLAFGADKEDVVLFWKSTGTFTDGYEVGIGEAILLSEEGTDGKLLDKGIRAGLADAVGEKGDNGRR